MASYDAQINILVAGQRNINNLLGQLNQVEDAIAQIESRYEKAAAAIKNADIRLGVIGRQQPRGEGGRLAKDPNRQARFAALADSRRAAVEQRLARMNLGTALRAEGSIRNQVEDGKEALRQAEKKITLQQRLNSAVELFETRQKKLIRGGGGRGLSQGLQEQAREIQAAFQAAGGGASRNLALINSLATGLGRIVERQNEFNRAQSLGKKGFEAGRRLQERIEAVAERGVIPSQRINRLKRGAAKVLSASDSGDQQAYSEAVRAATAAVNRVERESRKLARDLAKNATRSPILGGTNFPGSPKAVEAQRRAQEVALRQSQKGYPASPILGTAAMAGSPRAVQAQERAQAAADRALRAQERAAKVAETAADKALRESQKGFPSSPLLGAAGMAGSPKALQAQERNRAAVERRMATQRRAEERAAKLQQQAAAAAERAADRALEEARKGYPSSPVLGGASMGGSPRWKTAQESAKRKVETAARATERAADKAITEAQKGYPASPILGTATMVGSPRAAQAQERSRAAADRALRAQERVAKAAEAAVDRALKQAQQGYPTSPVSGSATMVGSPRALQAQQRAQVAADRALRAQARAAKVAETAADKALAQAQKGFPSSPILGTAAMAGSPRAMQAQERARAAADRALRSQERAVKAAQSAADKALEQAKKGYPASPILGTATTAESPRWKRAQQAAEKKLEAAAKATGAAADKALLEAQKGYPASPILGTATMAGSPRWKAAQERLAGRAGGTAGSGLQEALQSLQEARGARESFFGGASPAEGIDKIVREFNTGKTGGAASGAAGVADSVTESFTTGLKTGIPQAVSAAIAFSQAVIDAFRNKFKARSPAKAIIEEVIIPIVQAFEKLRDFTGRGVSAGKSFASSVMDSITGEVPDVVDKTRQASAAGYMPGERSDLATRLASFTSRLSSKPSLSRKFANLAGEDISSSPAISEAIYRKGYEAGQIVPAKFLPVGERVGLRGTAGLPGGGLEDALRASAFSRASRTGAFVGPLAEPARSTSGILDPRGQAFGASSLPSGAPTGTAGIFDAQVANAQKVTDSVYSMVGKNTFRDFSQQAAQITAKSKPGFVDELRTNARMASADILGKAEAASASVMSKGRSGIAAAAQRGLQAADEAQSLISAGSGGVVDRAKQGVRQLLEFFRSIGDFVAPNYENLSREPAKQIRRGIFAEGGPTYGKTFVSGQGEDRYKLGYSEGMFGIPDDLQDIPLKGGNKIKNALESFYDKIVATLGGAGGGGPRPPVGGGPGGGFYSDPDDLTRRAAEAAQQGPEGLLGLKELAAPAKVSTKELEALSAILKEFRSVLDPTIQGFDRLDNQLRETTANLDRQVQRRAPDADFLTRRVGPRAGSAISEGLIGGAFPLLFGQGIGASVGGGLGGAAGGFLGGGLGFGLSLIGTALGTVFDTLAQAAQDTGKALNYPIEGFESLKAAGLFASRQQEYYISKLIETGQSAKAAAEIQAEMIKKIGVSGVNDLAELGDASSRLGKAWAEFNLQLQAALAGPMAGLLEWVASIVALGNERRRDAAFVKTIEAGLTGEDLKRFRKQESEITKLTRTGYAFGGIGIGEAAERRTALARSFAPLANAPKVKGGGLTPEQEVADLDKAIEKADKARSLIQQGVALERGGIDLRLSVEDTVYGLRKRASDMEREAIEFRRSVEDQIFSKRQELEQKLIENERKRQQNAIDAFDLQLQKASTGLDPVAQGVVDAARDYLRIRAEGEADLQQAEKQLKLELQGIDQEVNRYKLQVEDRVSQMAIQRDEFSRDVSRARLQIERQIADRVVQVEEYRLAMAKHRYEVEINLEKKKQIVAQEGLAVQATGGYTGDKVDGFPIGSRPGMRRHPITGQLREHKGVDIPAPTGTALGYEIGGKILSAGWIDGYGKTLRVELENGMIALSAHLNEIFVTAGQKFQANQRLATVGSTGNSTGPHVHQESRMNGKADPYASLPFLQLGKAVSGKPGAGSDPDIYLQPGVGYFSRKTGRMVRGLTGGAGQAASAGASAQTASGASGAMGAAPALQAAPAMPVLPSAPQLVGINDLMQEYLQIVGQIKAATVNASVVDKQALAIRSENARLALEQQTLAPILQYKEQSRELEFEIQKRKERNRLLTEGVRPEIVEGELRVLEISRDLNSVLAGLEVSTNEAVKAELARLKLNPLLVDSTFALTEATLAGLVATTEDTKKQEELRAKLQGILDLKNQLAERAGGEASSAVDGARGMASAEAEYGQKIATFIAEATSELNNLEQVAINVSQGIGNAVGNSLSSGISGLIEGTATAKEVFAGFLRDIGQLLVQEGTKMIATYIAIAIAKSFAGLGGGGLGFGGASDPLGAGGAFWKNANGNAFTGSGVVPFAKGGTFTNSVVSSPTLFKFANGGTTQMGEMGEAGPEAIMPLSRGRGGRLGVDASGLREAMGRPPGGATGSPVLNMSFQSTTINGVEYVSRDQLEQAMAATRRQAASDGANRGMSMTLDKLQQSPSTRSRLGIGGR